MMAYLASSKSIGECVKALKHFGGKRPFVEFYADNTLEYESAASQLGLVYDATVPYSYDVKGFILLESSK